MIIYNWLISSILNDYILCVNFKKIDTVKEATTFKLGNTSKYCIQLHWLTSKVCDTINKIISVQSIIIHMKQVKT